MTRHKNHFCKHSDRIITNHGYDCPSGKFGYATKAMATQEISVLTKTREVPYPMYTYKCPHCRSWHMTRKERE